MPRPTFDPGFSTPDMTAIFEGSTRVRRMLDVEAAIAIVQGRHGVIPEDAAEEIAAACRDAHVDASRIDTQGWERGTPVIPLLETLRDSLGQEARPWLHHGATTQDIVDTALVLQCGEAVERLGPALSAIGAHLETLAHRHAGTPVTGRTFLQPAAGTSFGLVAATWTMIIRRARAGLEDAADTLPIQFGGPVGDLAALGAIAGRVVDDLAAELGLRAPGIPWHTDRSPIRDLVRALTGVADAVTKVARDLVLFAQHGEVTMRPGGSSSMPHKQNPFDAIHAIAAAQAGGAAAGAVLGSPPHEMQRAAGAWHAEWWAVPMTFHCVGAAVFALDTAVTTMEVDAEAMAANLAAAGLAPVPTDSARVWLSRLGQDEGTRT